MLWKAYFYIYTFLNIVGFLVLLPQLSTYNFATWEGLLETLFLILGTYVFVFKKKMFSKNVWKGLFIVILTIWLLQLTLYANAVPFLTPYLMFLKTSVSQSYGGVSVSVVISIPALYAIYKLGFSKNKRI